MGWIYLVPLGILGLLLASGLPLYAIDCRRFRTVPPPQRGERAQGVIVGFRNKKALVRFETGSGVVRQFKASFADARPVYDKGMRVDVLYLPEDPAVADIGDFNHGMAPVLAQLMGGLLFTCVWLLFIASWKWKRQERSESDGDPFQGGAAGFTARPRVKQARRRLPMSAYTRPPLPHFLLCIERKTC